MRRYVLSPEASEDLQEIRDYLKRVAGTHVAKSNLEKIKEALTFLSETPGAGHRREDLTDAPVKFWSVFSYLIVYDPSPRPIEIVRVLHGARDVAVILREDRDG